MFEKLFGKKKHEPMPPARDVRKLTESLTAPAIHIVKTEATTRSHLGGTPGLPPGMAWPIRSGKPLGFLARIDLPELHNAMPIPWLPASGALLFFYDIEEQPWGFDPKDRGGWAVIHVPNGETSSVAPANGDATPRMHVGFRRIQSYPSYERDSITALELTDEESELLIDICGDQFENQPRHQTGGFPSPVQGDSMELECQLASNGIYCGDSTGYEDPRVEELEKSAGDWKLLLQFDSDDDLEVMWGDAGMLYFWVREQEAQAGNFANAWLVLQCS